MLTQTMNASPLNTPRLTQLVKKILFSSLVILGLCVFSWIYVDIPVAEFFHQSRLFRQPSKIITRLGNSGIWIVGAAIGIIYGFYKEEAKSYISKFLALVLSLAASGLLVTLLKIMVGRYRPRAWVHQGIYSFDPFGVAYSKCSFPSGHSQTIFAVMVSLAFIFPKGRWIFLGLALLVSATRIALTNHFISDVIVGAYIGTLMAILFYHYRETVLAKIGLS